VGIFVNRDFGLVPKMNHHIRVVFVRPPDHREALAIAWRMARSLGTQLLVVQILLLGEMAEVDTLVHNEAQGLDEELDEEYI